MKDMEHNEEMKEEKEGPTLGQYERALEELENTQKTLAEKFEEWSKELIENSNEVNKK